MKFSHAWLRTYVAIAEEPAAVGARLTAAGLPLDGIEGAGEDAVYDFDMFANRPDCMSHLGLAREYAALTGAPLQRPEVRLPEGGPETARVTSIAIDSPDLCRRYSARCVLGVRIGPSPAWLRQRLESIGLRSISNVVDATNFVLWETGHPLHAFDLDRLEGRRIVVRLARPGEMLTTLDGTPRTLGPDVLVIADARRPVALAGIMGGLTSEIAETTRDILIESAWFDPVVVRRTARALGLRTDASHRFERGADPEGTVPALDRAASLIASIAGGTITGPPIDAHPRPAPPLTVSFRPSRARALLGFPLEPERMREALERRAFRVQARSADLWEATVPSFRRDIEREVDLIEEAARHRGYDAIPSLLPILADAGAGRSPADRRVRAARRALRTAGLSEAINYSMGEKDEGALFDPLGTGPCALENPLQAQASHLRSSLLPGLLRNAAHNANHSLEACHLFEIGTVFLRRDGRPEERTAAAFVMNGHGPFSHWSLPPRETDFYDALGALDVLWGALRISRPDLSSDRIPFLESGACFRLLLEGRPVGVTGQAAGAVVARYGIERPVFCAEIDLSGLPDGAGGGRYRPVPRFPAVRRDLALVIARSVTFAMVQAVVRRAATVPVVSVRPFDRYRGRGIPEGCVSLAIQLVFQHPDRTLSAEEVQEAQDAIVGALGRELGARLRGPAGA